MSIPIPIIRLEVQGIKHTVQTALMNHHLQISNEMQESIERFCTPENLQTIIDKEVRDTLDATIRAEVRDFFGYGRQGRKAVKEAIIEHLDRQYPDEMWKGEG